MIRQETQEQTKNRVVKNLRSTVSTFTNDILNQFETAFDELTRMYDHKSREDKQKIKEQAIQIRNLESSVDKFKKGYDLIRQMFQKNPMINRPSQDQKVYKKYSHDHHHNYQIESRDSSVRPERTEDFSIKSQAPKLNPSYHQKNPENNHLQKIKTEDHIDIEKQQKSLLRSQNNRMNQDSESEQSPSSSEDQDQGSESQNQKNPLRCSKSHSIYKVSYTPNITKISCTLYEQEKKDIIDESDVRTLGKYDLSEITSVLLSTKQMTDRTFSLFTKLKWTDLRILRLDNNFISDIRPLKNLELEILKDLDVSFNHLNQQSAQFLAQEPFKNLIYLTVSFDQGTDQECWEIMLQNQLKNYPKLQNLDIGNQAYLVISTKRSIEKCLSLKAQEQRTKQLRELGRGKYPQDYRIKIRWLASKQAYDNYNLEQITKINTAWIEQVGYTKQNLPKLKERVEKVIKQVKIPRELKGLQNKKETKSKPIKKQKSRLTKDGKKDRRYKGRR